MRLARGGEPTRLDTSLLSVKDLHMTSQSHPKANAFYFLLLGWERGGERNKGTYLFELKVQLEDALGGERGQLPWSNKDTMHKEDWGRLHWASRSLWLACTGLGVPSMSLGKHCSESSRLYAKREARIPL